MLLRPAIAAVIAIIAAPAFAEPMNVDQARDFVVGRNFAFTCFDGTAGQGRIQNDGSVAGRIRLQGKVPERFVSLPADTLRVRGDAVCAWVQGMAFEPCFDLVRTSTRSFRGTLAGVPGLWCDFVRTGRSGLAAAPRRGALHQAAN